MKAIILARVSDKKQDSNEAQVMRVSDYVRLKGLQTWKTYEIEESSTKGDREKFQGVVKEIKSSREPVALVVDTVDRLQRSFKESVLLDDLRKAGKLEIHFYRENLIISRESNSADLLRWDMAVMFARSYVLQLSDNVKRKLERMRRSGEWVSKPPLGYKSVYDALGKRTTLVPDTETAPFIKTIFELCASGNHSTKTIREAITRQGFTTRRGKPIAFSMVDYILHNPFYYGLMRTKGKYYAHHYEPLISENLFFRCRAIREKQGKKQSPYASKPYIFRGLVKCAACGSSMSPETAKHKFIYYSCAKAKRGLCDSKVYVPEKSFLKPVFEVLKALNKVPQSVIHSISEEFQASDASKTQYHKDVIQQIQNNYNTLQSKINKLTDFLLEGVINQEDFEIKLKELKDRQRDANLQLEEHTEAEEHYYVTVCAVLKLAKNSLPIFKSSNTLEKRELLKFLIQNCTSTGKKLAFTILTPFDQLVLLAKHPNRLPDLDMFRTVNWHDVQLRMEKLDQSIQIDKLSERQSI